MFPRRLMDAFHKVRSVRDLGYGRHHNDFLNHQNLYTKLLLSDVEADHLDKFFPAPELPWSFGLWRP